MQVWEIVASTGNGCKSRKLMRVWRQVGARAGPGTMNHGTGPGPGPPGDYWARALTDKDLLSGKTDFDKFVN